MAHISEKYWATSIVDAAIQVLGLFFLKESMPVIPCDLDVLIVIIFTSLRTISPGTESETYTPEDRCREGPVSKDIHCI